MVHGLQSMHIVPRLSLAGAACAGFVGGIVGLVIGLRVYAPTAWFAVFELAVPAAFVGAFLGMVAGLLVLSVRRLGSR